MPFVVMIMGGEILTYANGLDERDTREYLWVICQTGDENEDGHP